FFAQIDQKDVDARDVGERSDAVLRTAMRGHDEIILHPSILEKSATARVAARISLSSLRRFSRTFAASAPSVTLTVTLSKKASTCGRSSEIAAMAPLKFSVSTAAVTRSFASKMAFAN